MEGTIMMRLGDHCGKTLRTWARDDDTLWVLDGDLADSNGAIHFAEAVPERFVMAGIAEQGMVSMAAGMASCGQRPWVFSFAAFLAYRAYDQVRVCLSHARQPVTLVASHSGGLSSRNGKSHAALNDVALMASLPHMHVWAPAGPSDLRRAMQAIRAAAAPAYLRLPRCPLPDLSTACLRRDARVTAQSIEPNGVADCSTEADVEDGLRRLTPESDVVLVGTGVSTHWALEACAVLAEQGVEASVIHCARLSPWPRTRLRRMTSEARAVFVLDDHSPLGGLYSLVAQTVETCPVYPLTWPESWCGQSGDDDDLRAAYQLDAPSLALRITSALSPSSAHPLYSFKSTLS